MKTMLLMPEMPLTQGGMGRTDSDAPQSASQALTRALLTVRSAGVTTLTRADVRAASAPAVRLAERLVGPDAALAVMGYLRRHEYDVVFTGGEAVGLPFAALCRAGARRPAHVSVAHRLSIGGWLGLSRCLGLRHGVDSLFVHSQAQRDFAEDRFGVAGERLVLIPPPVDDRFFRPCPDIPILPDHLCAVGRSRRDYATLLEAVVDMPNLHIDVADHPATLALSEMPLGRGDYTALRALYARSLFVAVPLRETDFAAGSTTILQAMAMGKAVIATQTEGQTDLIVEGVTGLTVPPGDVAGWRQAITRLRSDGVLRERLGRNARRWVEENAALEPWAGRVAETLRSSAFSMGAAPSSEVDALIQTLQVFR